METPTQIKTPIVYEGYIIINRDFVPMVIVEANLTDVNKRVYGVKFDYTGTSKNIETNEIILTDDGDEVKVSTTVNEYKDGYVSHGLEKDKKDYELIDLKTANIIYYDNEIRFWKALFLFYYIFVWAFKIVKYESRFVAGVPLPYRDRYVATKYANHLKVQHFTEIAEKYISDKKDIGKWLKKNNFNEYSFITSKDLFDAFGTKYHIQQITTYIKHKNYLNSDKN